ncbi:hypothetical protein Q7P37_005453 [Cladosporium fusiforme]
MSSSPLRPGATRDEELEYYKRQYEQLEADLADFQASSKELEEQLEKDVDAAEKNERKLKEQVEKLNFEVDEWKAKHKQSKAEANNAQNALQKEITTIREQHRGLTLKLRDIEVANDDYERQARNTTSSLEDLEAKLNVSIERNVLMEEEIKIGEKEREGLRIETQRLRDELGDLKVESEIRLEKLRRSENTIESLRSRKPSPLAVESLRARSPISEASATPTSPTASTCTPSRKSDSASDAPTPPSPPLSDAPAHTKIEPKTPIIEKRRSLLPDSGATPRHSLYASRHRRGPSLAPSNNSATSDAKSMKPPRARSSLRPEGIPRSESLNQMKSLRSRMQKIEERVHSARSKLPPPHNTPRNSPRNSPRAGAGPILPSSITVRRTSKRPSSINPSVTSDPISEDGPPLTTRRESHVKRLSYGIPRPRSTVPGERPPSALAHDRPPSSAAYSRPSSRISIPRPESRAGASTPSTSHYGDTSAASTTSRPRSSGGPSMHSIAGSTSPRKVLHRTTQSISEHAAAGRAKLEASEEASRRASGLPPGAWARSTAEHADAPSF